MKTKRIVIDFAKCQEEGQHRLQRFRWLLENEVAVSGRRGPCNFTKIAKEFGAYVTAVDGRDVRVPPDINRQGIRFGIL